MTSVNRDKHQLISLHPIPMKEIDFNSPEVGEPDDNQSDSCQLTLGEMLECSIVFLMMRVQYSAEGNARFQRSMWEDLPNAPEPQPLLARGIL